MFDSTSILADELLSMFGKNTCVTVTHDYGSKALAVKSARTNNVIWECEDITQYKDVLEFIALNIMSMKKFPKNRKMNRSWSPIRLTAKAQADQEITRATAIVWGR